MNKTVVDLDLRRKTGCSLIGFKSANNEYIINPEPTIMLAPNTKLILLGNENQIEKLQALFD
jgi:voltage-gated potassium channel